ncbi:hypothetical protein VB711_19800 [Cronbergia sp. UHCC 0137]|uniref:hypothetical protein n=1 Tax=Cronbergia sp. UHCC 0137 TaxID=3110239 RepID=UPI002B1FF354|nr:hypothetical protein [Cronbergia sp. UHCC 0137]MEA5620072.1 hypothetical protein [Cronbergia sp. UHCC 0137]
MTQNLTQQWLAEIQALKQQIAQLQQKCDEAWESSQKWRQLYNTESEQRRTDAKMYQQAISMGYAHSSVKTESTESQSIDMKVSSEIESTSDEQEIIQITSVEELQTRLITVTQERDRFLKALKIEQENHTETRQGLTNALGDAIDSLTRLRAEGAERAKAEKEEE